MWHLLFHNVVTNMTHKSCFEAKYQPCSAKGKNGSVIVRHTLFNGNIVSQTRFITTTIMACFSRNITTTPLDNCLKPK